MCAATDQQEPMSRSQRGGPIGERIPPALLHEREQVILATKPSLWLVMILSWRWIAGALLIAAALVIWHPTIGQADVGRIGIIVCGILAFGRLAAALLQWAGRNYVLTDQRVIAVEGVLSIEVFQCDLSKLQNTYLLKPLIPRLLGLGHIVFATAGTAVFEAVWSYCNTPLKVHEEIMKQLSIQRPQPLSP